MSGRISSQGTEEQGWWIEFMAGTNPNNPKRRTIKYLKQDNDLYQ